MSATVYVARHGETTWNVAGRYQGRRESALSGLGMAQAAKLGGYFAERCAAGARLPRRVVASPLLRCTATAQVAAAALDVPVTTDERIVEIAHGSWEGRYRDEIARNDPARYRAWKDDPANVAFDGGETVGAVRERWRAFAASLATTEDDVLVVTHDAVCRVALLDALGRGLGDLWHVCVENAAFARYSANGAALALVEECHTAHLAGLRATLEDQAL